MERFALLCLTLVLVVSAPLLAQPDSLWSRTYGSAGRDECLSLVKTADGGYALAGVTDLFGSGYWDICLVRTDENGDSLWSRTYGEQSGDGCHSLLQTNDGGFALAGYTDSFGAGAKDFWLVRTDENGDSLWSRTFGGELNDYCMSLAQTTDGGYGLAGYTYSFGAGEDDFWLVKTGPDPVSVPESDFIIHPSAFILSPPYPNPFNSRAVSNYKLQVSSWVELGLYDLSGRLVQTLAEGWQEAGSHQAVIDGTLLPSGVYLLKLTAGRESALSKVCVMR